jgi:hypothetical protein
MSEFDDPILRDRLSRYAGAPPDSETAYLGVQQRVRHVKRRRVAIWSGAAAIVIGVGAANALQGPDGAKVTVPPTASTPVANTVAATSTSTTSTSTTATSTTATSTTATTTAATTIATQPAAPEVMNPETALGTPNSGDAGGAPPSESATASRPAALPADGEEHDRSAAGGTMRVRLANGSLTLVSATPNDEYTVRVDDDTGSRIRVVFEHRSAASMITATLVGDEIRFRVWERGGDQDDPSHTTIDDERDNDDRDRDDNRDGDDDRDDDRDDNDRDGDRWGRDDRTDNRRDRPRHGDTDGTYD